jgi:hypothetical protein
MGLEDCSIKFLKQLAGISSRAKQFMKLSSGCFGAKPTGKGDSFYDSDLKMNSKRL